jgi:hypothetical protein
MKDETNVEEWNDKKSLISLTSDESFIVIFDKITDQLYWCELPNRLSDLFDPSFESELVEESLPSVFNFENDD